MAASHKRNRIRLREILADQKQSNIFPAAGSSAPFLLGIQSMACHSSVDDGCSRFETVHPPSTVGLGSVPAECVEMCHCSAGSSALKSLKRMKCMRRFCGIRDTRLDADPCRHGLRNQRGASFGIRQWQLPVTEETYEAPYFRCTGGTSPNTAPPNRSFSLEVRMDWTVWART